MNADLNRRTQLSEAFINVPFVHLRISNVMPISCEAVLIQQVGENDIVLFRVVSQHGIEASLSNN